MKLENPIILELESRSKSNPNSLASRLNLLANDLMDQMVQHHKRVIQVMPEFDLHDESHLEKVLLYMAQLIGDEIIKTLSDIELFLLVASAYMHDCGMARPEWELKLMELYVKYRPYNEHFNMLTGREKKKFHSEYCYELDEYQKAVKKLKDWYPSGSVPSLELLRKTIGDLEAEQKQKKQLYTQTADETETLSKSLQKIEQYLGNEQERA